ncbi:MAG: hypothetical protein QOJ00_2418 [Actinomycetota bacterium]|jgi:hypothetical protein
MTRVVIDPNELAALSALCRNTSYDIAGIATEALHRMDHVASVAGADALRVRPLVDHAAQLLHRVAAQLDDDALAVATLGQRGASADALGELGGNEHSLLTRFNRGDTP